LAGCATLSLWCATAGSLQTNTIDYPAALQCTASPADSRVVIVCDPARDDQERQLSRQPAKSVEINE